MRFKTVQIEPSDQGILKPTGDEFVSEKAAIEYCAEINNRFEGITLGFESFCDTCSEDWDDCACEGCDCVAYKAWFITNTDPQKTWS